MDKETPAEDSAEKVSAEPDEGEAFVPLSPRRRPTEVKGPAQSVNLVKLLEGLTDSKGRDVLKRMAGTCLDDYDADVKSRGRRMKRIRDFQELYASIMKAKSFPFQNCANVNLPFLTYPCLQVQARLYDMVVPANGKIMIVSPTNTADVERAGLCEKFANSYIRHDMADFATSMDESLTQVVPFGSMFRRTYWNNREGKVCSDFIPIDDFVVAYWQKSTDPSMRDVPRYTLVLHPTLFDLEEDSEDGFYENVDQLKVGDASRDDSKNDGVKEMRERLDGVSEADEASDEGKARMVLEQYRKWRMPNKPKLHPAFDGKAHAVIITIDEASEKILRVVIREEEDPKDAVRFAKEMAMQEEYVASVEAHTQATSAFVDANAIATMNKIPLPPDITDPGPPPLPPEGVETGDDGAPVPPRPVRMRPISMFTHYKCFHGEGFYGHGFGDFLAPLARAANAILNQRLDNGTLRNAAPGFISKQLRGQRGAINVQPGELVEVDAPMGSIREGIYFLDPPMPDPETMKILQLLQEMSEKFGGNDVMSGQPSGSNQTARGTIILNENAMAQLSVLSRRIKEAEKHELDKIWRCWGTYLPDEEIQADIVDENGVPGTVPITRALFTPDARVMPASDPRGKTQKVEETTALYTMATQNPVLAANPAVMQALTEDMLRAMDANKIIPLMQPPEPPPPQPKKFWEEDANFLRGQDSPVLPEDDDDKHIEGHTAFRSTPAGQMLEKTAVAMHDAHIRSHAANRLDKAGKEHEQMVAMAQMGGNGQQPQEMQQ